MSRCRWVWLIALGALVGAGCGKATLPGQQFKGERPDTSAAAPTTGPLPEKGVVEWGDAEAKVRLTAFFPIDEAHQGLMDLLEALVEEYPGKVYVRYVDNRTPEGAAIFQRAGASGRALMINAESSVTIEDEPGPYTVDFVQDMGRYWTAEELKKAVAQEVARQY